MTNLWLFRHFQNDAVYNRYMWKSNHTSKYLNPIDIEYSRHILLLKKTIGSGTIRHL